MTRILLTGACGFVGHALARAWAEAGAGYAVTGLDNLSRPGSETNRAALAHLGATLHHGDLRCASDFETLPETDWVVDAAAVPSVLAGVDGRTSGRQLVEHNLAGTVNLLEYCRRTGAGFILLSTSRVYSIPPLAGLPVVVENDAFRPDLAAAGPPPGLTAAGVGESFSTAPPVSLYGATKVASEALALEYGATYGFPVWVDRCGVLAGAGQFGHAAQGIFSYWVHAWKAGRPLLYIGFGGRGHQVRDCLHPADLAPVLTRQMDDPGPGESGHGRVFNLAGGTDNARSLATLSAWCRARFGPREVGAEDAARPFDIPWLVLDPARARERWGFAVQRPVENVLEEIAQHAEANPGWLDGCG